MKKEEILAQLTAAYHGPGSTEEGSFAGDVLRACADAMAELWSTDIDGLEYRAFVSTAVGEWLTKVCADRGVERRGGETDEELRARALELMAKQPASGNADHYAAWCAEAGGILRVKVLPLARGNGTVDIVAVGRDGKAPEADALQEAQAYVDAQRPVGADARVVAAEETALDISASVVLMEGRELATVQAAFETALAGFCRDNALQVPVVSYAKLLRLLLDCDGVADVRTFALCGGEESLALAERAAAVAGSIVLAEAQV